MLATSYDEFFAGGIGTYLWVDSIVNMKPTLSLLLKVPYVRDGVTPSTGSGIEILRLFPRRSETEWSEAGPIKGWDGNAEYPTLVGSIWHDKPHGWHGFLEKGVLRSA